MPFSEGARGSKQIFVYFARKLYDEGSHAQCKHVSDGTDAGRIGFSVRRASHTKVLVLPMRFAC